MLRSLTLACCALLCLFVLSVRSEVNVPWPPSSLSDCDAPWDRYGDAYNFCHVTMTGTHTDADWDGFSVSDIEIEPCNWDYFLLDSSSYGDLQVGDWLQVSIDYTVATAGSDSLDLLLSYTGVPPTSITYDVEFSANTSFSISPWTLSKYPQIWIGVGNYLRFSDTAPGSYELSIERFRPFQECEECLCVDAWGYTDISLATTTDDQIVLTGSISYSNDTRPDFADDVEETYALLRNFHFNVPSSAYRAGAYLDINITILDDSSSANAAYLSAGPYAVDPLDEDYYSKSVSLAECNVCPNDLTIAGTNCHLYLTPCEFYYGDYYLSILFDDFCPTGASYEITVNVIAPVVQALTLAGSPSSVSFSNNLQTNIFLGAQAGYSQYDHYVVTVSGITDRTHAFARLSSVYGYNLGLYMRASDQAADAAIAYEDRDRVLVPVGFNGNSVCDDGCYEVDFSCQTTESSIGQACGCSFIVRSCDLEETDYYLSVVPSENGDAIILDVLSYHIDVSTYEDNLQATLVPGQPISTTLAVWSPFQVYVFATPNTVDTWAVFELFVRAPSSEYNQLAQPALTLDLLQNFASLNDAFVCSDADTTALQTCTTASTLYTLGDIPDVEGIDYPTACHMVVDSCKLQYGSIYLSIYPDAADISSFGINGGHWDFVLWGDLETAWALDSNVTYTDRVRVGQYNHYYIDVDDSIEAGAWLSVDFENTTPLDSADFISYLNYEALAGDCPCYQNVDVCQLSSGTLSSSSCDEDNSCDTDVHGWSSGYGFDLEDTSYAVSTETDAGACRVQATVCTFRPGRWFISATAVSSSSGSGTPRSVVPENSITVGSLPVNAGTGVQLVGYTVTARIHAAPVVNELEFNTQVTEQLQPDEILHFQLTDVDAAGDDLVVSVSWYSEVLSRFYAAQAGSDGSNTLPKAFPEDWGIELRLNFGDLAFEECYEHPWSCKATPSNGGSCQIIVPSCKWAVVDSEQIFVSARYNRGLISSSYFEGGVGTSSTQAAITPLDVLAPEFWVGDAQINLQVTSERAEVTTLSVGSTIYGSVLKDRYAHYSFQLLATSALRTDIDVYFHVQSTYDSDSAPIVALNSGSLAGNGRGCRDCFTTTQSCQNNFNCHWTFDSCNSLSTGTTYYLSVYKPVNAFFNQALEFSVALSQQDLVTPVSLGAANRLTSTIVLQDGLNTRAFFAIDGSTLPERATPLDHLSIRVWNNGIGTPNDLDFTYYLNHDGLAGSCDCYGALCQESTSITAECPIVGSDNHLQIVDNDLTAGTYFLTFEFAGVSGSDAIVLTIEAEAVIYDVVARTPNNLRASGTEFFLGDDDLRFGEDITLDYNDGYNMDEWLVTIADEIDWDETNNVIRDEKIYAVSIPQAYGLQSPDRFADGSLGTKFYAITITNPATEPGHVLPDRVFLGIDNIRSDLYNCYSKSGIPELQVDWFGTEERALTSALSNVNNDDRICQANSLPSYPIGSPIASSESPVLFTELPVCLFTHAQTATHLFAVTFSPDENDIRTLNLATSATNDLVVPAIIYDIRFFLQEPIAMQELSDFYVGPDYVSETVDFPYTTTWQSLQNSLTDRSLAFKQRFSLDLSASDVTDSLVQVVIETDNQLLVTVNGDYAPNFNLDEGCQSDSCSSRSLLEFRQSTLSYLQLNPDAIASDSNVSDAGNNTLNFVDPNSDLTYSCAPPSCVFTLDPCALSQSSLWFFDIVSNASSNASFAIYYTEPEDLLASNTYDITSTDIEERNWVPTGVADFGGVDGVDSYEFYRISSDVLAEVLSGEGRPRLEIQVAWQPKFDAEEFANEQWASIVISAEAPVYVRGQQGFGSNANFAGFPFYTERGQSNVAYTESVLPSEEDDEYIYNTYDSAIPFCFEPFYISVVGGAYNETNSAASLSERFFLDGCDLQGVSELWLTARMLTPGFFDYQFLVRVVRDKEIDLTDLTIGVGYTAAASYTPDADNSIEPNSFNHNKFLLPTDLQTTAATLIVELYFPDDSIDRNNGTFWLLISADAPAGWASTQSPDGYISGSDSGYRVYAGLPTIGGEASYGSSDSVEGATAVYDCYSNLVDYSTDPIIFNELDTGIVGTGFESEYRSRRSIDLFNLRYATYLYVSVFYETPVWEADSPADQDDSTVWQSYELNVWLQSEPSASSPFIINQNITDLEVCFDGLDGMTTSTGIVRDDDGFFDYNISWAGLKSVTPTWFTFYLDTDLISLDCALSSTNPRCYFTQYLEFQIFNDYVQDYTYSQPLIGLDSKFTVFGPGSISIGGVNDFESATSDSDIFGGKWIVQDSHLAANNRFFDSGIFVGVNDSSPVVQFGPCSATSDGYSYLPDRDWEFGESFASPQSYFTLRPGTYYLPVWSLDSLDFTVCATLNSIDYDYEWTTVDSTPYEPAELTAYDADDADSTVVTLAQAFVDWTNETESSYDYYWFSLAEDDISSEQYLQIWLDRVADCSSAGCTSLASDDSLILQVFRSDCQLWSCTANGEGAGCEGRWTTGFSNDEDFGVVSRFILGGAGLSPNSLTAGDFFIKVNLAPSVTYTLSAYLRTPPTTVVLTEAVAVRSTIFSTAYQHYVFTASDTSTSLLTSLSVSLSEVLCGSLEMFAKHGTPAGPFYPTTYDARTFIGSQMYYQSVSIQSQSTRFAGSSLEKAASAYCAAADGERSCTINIGTTELSKDLDSTGLIGSTTWYFAVRAITTNYTTDNDEIIDGTSDDTNLPFDDSDSDLGNGFNEPATYFITATTTYSDLYTSQSIGCAVTATPASSDECSDADETANPNAQIYQFGFQTITLFTNAHVDAEEFTFSVNATVHEAFIAFTGVNQFVEPIAIEDGSWTYQLSSADLSVVGPQNVFYDLTSSGTVFADFYHHPVTALLPGVVYPSTGLSPSALTTSSSFLSADHIYYEFSPALTSTPSFSLTYINTKTNGSNCLAPLFWTESDCGVFSSSEPNDSDFFNSCGVLPRFVSFTVNEGCSASCTTTSCDSPFQWEFSYSTSLSIIELELGVVSCGSSWTSNEITAQLTTSESTDWLLFSLPATPDFDGTTANWLSLDFYPSVEETTVASSITLFESSSFTCAQTQDSDRDGFYDTQNSFICPSFGFLATPSGIFIDASEASITPSLFSIDVIAADSSLSTASPVSTVIIPIASTDFTQFDFNSGFAIYSFTVPDLDSSVSWLSVEVDTSSCSSVSSWLNFESPVPAGCDDIAWALTPCQVNSGVYYVSLRTTLFDSAYFPEWAGSITVTLKTDPVLAVPSDGSFSVSYTIDAGASVILQTSLSSDWLKSHPALQSAIIYRVISPLGIWTLDANFNSEPSTACFDCLVPIVSTELTNDFDAPFTFTVQFELMTDLLYLIDPLMFIRAPAADTSVATSTTEPLWDETAAYPLLTPYLDQRSATITSLALGTAVSSQLYNAFTSRQIQVYVVDVVTANTLAQLRLANVVGGVVSMQVFAASLDRSCGEFKECHSAPVQWSDNHQLLQASPLNNIAGSCSVVYSPCEWAAYPSWFVVLNDHVLNQPDANLEVFTSPEVPSGVHAGGNFSFTYSTENSTLPISPVGVQALSDFVPSQNNPFVAVTFDLIVTEESWTALNSTATASQLFDTQASTSRSEDNAAGNWQHFFYSYEASGVTSVRIIVDVSAASALATSGVWVTVTDLDCGCSHLFRNVWCSAEYPSWLCEIEVALHAEHPLDSTTFYVDVYGLKGSFTVAATEGVDGNCVYSDGESFCPSRVLNYPFWPSLDSSDLDDKASCLYSELLSYFEEPCESCFDVIGNDCQLALMDYACAATFQPCDVDGFIDASICVDKCTAVESACPISFIEAGLPNLDCGHARYSSSNCF